ncbi:MAG TPA: ABC-2 family transporter protein [Patescibacteria group bacterium]
MKKYLKVWWLLTIKGTQIALSSRMGAILFLIGKLLRLSFFVSLIVLIAARTNVIAGYTLWQMIFFYLTFNVIDTLAQLLLREVYEFHYNITSGYFDNYIVKPVAPLFRALFGGSDILDVPIFLLLIIATIFAAFHIGHISFLGIILYFLLLINSMLIALAFHIGVLCLGILTTEIDNAIMFYRDLTQMGRMPIDIYKEPLRGLITFIVPVGIMMTFPVKALLGLLSWWIIILSLAIGIVLFLLSLWFWKYALRFYTSASS